MKCPSIDYLLANMKLVQTALASGSAVLSRFGSAKDVEMLAETFARQTVLSTDFFFADAAVIDRMVAECRSNPSKFVLKPQREGGGNNIFGGESYVAITRVITEINSTLGTLVFSINVYSVPTYQAVTGLIRLL